MRSQRTADITRARSGGRRATKLVPVLAGPHQKGRGRGINLGLLGLVVVVVGWDGVVYQLGFWSGMQSSRRLRPPDHYYMAGSSPFFR